MTHSKTADVDKVVKNRSWEINEFVGRNKNYRRAFSDVIGIRKYWVGENRYGATEVGSAEVGVRQVRVGDRLEHRWECENVARNQFLFVHDCVVNPEFDLQHDPVVLDSRGCPVDAIGMGEVRYSPDGRSGSSQHTAYKFADYPNLLFKCSINVCRTDVAVVGCPPAVPVDCSKTRNPRSSGIVQQNSTRDIVLSESIRFGDITEAVMDEVRQTIHYQCLSPNLVAISAAVSALLAILLIAVVALIVRRKAPEGKTASPSDCF
ncbi:hypothetical protein QR680_002970 [Steinernema hermaphroditum]|uniref:ZP domain-containing protein n=1 Tax=Steinernema hermaphroditum TaxID=289476 RepID=A0AA39LIT3_9BILA|nr:hypothetical protein QR680_002970 [Steinernema hermaphroditum]